MVRDPQGKIADAAPSGQHGNSSAGTSTVAGIIGWAQRFDGTDDYVECTTTGKLALADNFTISAWVKLDDTLNQRYYRIVSKKPSWNALEGYELECTPRLPVPDTGAVSVIGADSGLARSLFCWDTQWHFIAAAISAQHVRMFIDGVLITGGDDFLEAPLLGGSSPLVIGASIARTDFMKGLLDEIRISAVVRSDAWIRACWESQRNDQTLVSIYRY
jgi:hypothetical protein